MVLGRHVLGCEKIVRAALQHPRVLDKMKVRVVYLDKLEVIFHSVIKGSWPIYNDSLHNKPRKK